jgi:hypothetical protein
MTLVREARLKPEYAALYPGLMPGRWEAAATAADRVAKGIVAREGYVRLRRGRVLAEPHFEFRGQTPKGAEPGGRRRRLADRLG